MPFQFSKKGLSTKTNALLGKEEEQTPFFPAKNAVEEPFFPPAAKPSSPTQRKDASKYPAVHTEQQEHIPHQTALSKHSTLPTAHSGKVIQGGFWDSVKSVGSAIVGGVKSVGSSVVGGIKSAGSAIVGGVKSVASSVLGGIKKVGSAIGKGAKAVGNYLLGVAGSVGHWAKDLILEAPKRVWSIVKHIGTGIFKSANWLFDGAKGALGHLFDGLKGTIGWLGRGAKGAFNWLAGGLKNGASWAKKILNGDFSGFWSGIGNAFSWLGRGAKGLLKWGVEGLKGLGVWAKNGIVGFGKWLGRGLLGGLAWAGRMVAKLFDLVGGGELVEVLWQIVKINTRGLNGTERAEAVKVFGGSIDYAQVRIDEKSLISKISSYFVGGANAVTTFHTINFPHKINAQPCNGDMHWLMHELGHVAQYTHVGSQYMGEAIAGQHGAGYGYGGGAGLVGKDFKSFNREQQGDIIADYYGGVVCSIPGYVAVVGGHAAEYHRLKAQWQSGNM